MKSITTENEVWIWSPWQPKMKSLANRKCVSQKIKQSSLTPNVQCYLRLAQISSTAKSDAKLDKAFSLGCSSHTDREQGQDVQGGQVHLKQPTWLWWCPQQVPLLAPRAPGTLQCILPTCAGTRRLLLTLWDQETRLGSSEGYSSSSRSGVRGSSFSRSDIKVKYRSVAWRTE